MVTSDVFFQVFAKNSLMKNIFKEKKSLIVEHDFSWKMVPNCRGLQVNHDLSEKVQYSRNQAIKNGLNEAILLMSINKALLSRQNSVPFK